MKYYLELFFIFFSITSSFTDGVDLVIVNKCKQSIWPGILGTAGHPSPKSGGFPLYSGEQVTIQVPDKWSGRIWARQGCCFDSSGNGFCQTGDCSGLLQCSGTGGIPPATVVEMTLGTSQSPLHYYDVSLVDGFNLPVSMVPVGGGGGCGVAACEVDLNVHCPSKLVVRREGKTVGCKSACLAQRSDVNCCTGEFASPKFCGPNVIGRLFKCICPRAYAYPFDHLTGLHTCRAPMYVITFCPLPPS